MVSVPSFGDSFFIINNEDINGTVSPYGFPSPHSGILFLCLDVQWERRQSINVSVPSFGDSFFIVSPYGNGVKLEAVVSVPSFGDSFFMP